MRSNKRHLLAAALALVAVALSLPVASATELSAQAFGMGGAYTAVVDDMSAIVYNPSKLADRSFEVGIGLGASDLTKITGFQSLLSNPSELTGSDGELNLVTLSGLSLNSFGAGLAADGRLMVDSSCAAGDLCAEGEYNTQVLLGMGRGLTNLPFDMAGFKVGLSAKRLDGRRIEFVKVDNGLTYNTDTTDWRGQGYGLNAGVTFNATDIVTIGVTATDLYSSMTWNGTRTQAIYNSLDDSLVASVESDLGTETRSLTPVYRVGAAIRPPVLGGTIAADIASDGSVRYGIEKNLFANAVSLRAGQIQEEGKTTTTAGLGFNLGPVRLDAAVGSSDGFQTYMTMVEGSVGF